MTGNEGGRNRSAVNQPVVQEKCSAVDCDVGNCIYQEDDEEIFVPLITSDEKLCSPAVIQTPS
jgi:hypothetical protein